MFALFDENPAMTLQDIKETKRYGRMYAHTDNVKTVYPPQTKFAGGIMIKRNSQLEHTQLMEQRRGLLCTYDSGVARCQSQHLYHFGK